MPSGLLAYYKFAEGTGTTSVDSSGNGNVNAVLDPTYGLPTWIAGGGIRITASSANPHRARGATVAHNSGNTSLSVPGRARSIAFLVSGITGLNWNQTIGFAVGATYGPIFLLGQLDKRPTVGTDTFPSLVKGVPWAMKDGAVCLIFADDQAASNRGKIYVNGTAVGSYQLGNNAYPNPPNSPSYFYVGGTGSYTIHSAAFWDVGLDASGAAAADAEMKSQISARGLTYNGVGDAAAVSGVPYLLISSDSHGRGVGAGPSGTGDMGLTGWLGQLNTAGSLPVGYQVVNWGAAGGHAIGSTGTVADKALMIATLNAYGMPSRNLCLIDSGYNDSYALTVATQLGTAANDLVAAGCLHRVIFGTSLPGTGNSANRGPFDNSLKATAAASSGRIVVADRAADSGIGPDGANLVTTNYTTDQVHMNTPGHLRNANVYGPVILANAAVFRPAFRRLASVA